MPACMSSAASTTTVTYIYGELALSARKLPGNASASAFAGDPATRTKLGKAVAAGLRAIGLMAAVSDSAEVVSVEVLQVAGRRLVGGSVAFSLTFRARVEDRAAGEEASEVFSANVAGFTEATASKAKDELLLEGCAVIVTRHPYVAVVMEEMPPVPSPAPEASKVPMIAAACGGVLCSCFLAAFFYKCCCTPRQRAKSPVTHHDDPPKRGAGSPVQPLDPVFPLPPPGSPGHLGPIESEDGAEELLALPPVPAADGEEGPRALPGAVADGPRALGPG